MRKAEEISVSPVVAKKLKGAVRIRHQVDELDIVEYEFPDPLTREEAVALENRAWLRDRWMIERAWFKFSESDLLVAKLRLLRPSRKFKGGRGVQGLCPPSNEKAYLEKTSASPKTSASEVVTSASLVSTSNGAPPSPPKSEIAALALRAGDARLAPLIEQYVAQARRLPDIRSLKRLAGWPEYTVEDFLCVLAKRTEHTTKIPALGEIFSSESVLRTTLGLKPHERRTWLTAYAEAFKTAYPEATFLFGVWSKTLKRLEQQFGREQVLANWIRYANSTPSSFFSILSFESKWAGRAIETSYLPES